MNYHSETIEKTAKDLSSDLNNGLSSQKAALLLDKYGPNLLTINKKKSIVKRYAEQFKDIMIIILIAAAIISFISALREGNPKEFFEPVLILLIVILNAMMGVIQESRAEKALEALKGLSAPHSRVIRDGKENIINAENLVPGDIIRLEAGDFVPADARLIHSTGLKSDESLLTGESLPAEKNALAEVNPEAPVGDRINMIYSGCCITCGTAAAIVSSTGMNTEMGKIADMLVSESDTQTPLQKKLSQLGRQLGLIAVASCALIFITGIINGLPADEIFMTAVSLAVSAIPEGLPAIVTIILSIGVMRMVKHNAIIRRLPAVETLGSASVICSDKTGTLTQNRMTLVKAYSNITGNIEDITPAVSDSVRNLIKYASLCCNGSIITSEGTVRQIGDPTETSIIFAAGLFGMIKEELETDCPRFAELPFDSIRKLMTTINKINNKYVVIVKGAFDVMQSRCFSDGIAAASVVNEEMSSNALRVIAVAFKELDEMPDEITPEELESNLTFMGLLGMTDPPRPEAAQAVKTCIAAGIRPVMITGDHIVTASAVARKLGILTPEGHAITGTELDNMSDTEFSGQIENISVYARVSPENKIRIVKEWQKKGAVVAMTGDGVNDAPALKAADIGCAMGITGTDVAKGASDMTLTDDNFATIVAAVREGRGIYANIRKVVGFLLGTNIGEVLTVFTAMLLWHKIPLLSIQLLWINLVTDSLPAIALGMEPVDADIMKKKPRPKDESIFSHGFGIQIFFHGIMFGTLSILAFIIGEKSYGNIIGGRTLTFMVLSLSQIIQSYNMRSGLSLFKTGIFGNRYLNIAVLISVTLVFIVLFTPLSSLFGLVILPARLYVTGFCLILIPLIVMEISKAAGLIKHPH